MTGKSSDHVVYRWILDKYVCGREKGEERKKEGIQVCYIVYDEADSFTLEMLERIAYEEDKTRPEMIWSAVKLLFLDKYG